MWVDKDQLKKLQENTKHTNEYARKVMFKLLITHDEIIKLSKSKTHGVGFVKLFGKKNWTEFYGEEGRLSKLSRQLSAFTSMMLLRRLVPV